MTAPLLVRRAIRAVVRQYCRRSPIPKGKGRLMVATRRLAAPHREVVSLPGGTRMLVDLSDHVQRIIYFLGCYEAGVTHLITRTLRPGDTFIDIGANVGYYTVIAGALVGPTGTVHSFEPIQEIFAALQANVALNSLHNVQTNRTAVSDKEGDLELYRAAAGNNGTGSIIQRPASPGPLIRCPAVTLDAYMRREGDQPIRLVKMDIEGAEIFALRGMAGLLASPHGPDLICEVVPHLIQATGHTPEELSRFVESFGYRTRQITDHGLVEWRARGSSRPAGGWNLYFSQRGEG